MSNLSLLKKLFVILFVMHRYKHSQDNPLIEKIDNNYISTNRTTFIIFAKKKTIARSKINILD